MDNEQIAHKYLDLAKMYAQARDSSVIIRRISDSNQASVFHNHIYKTYSLWIPKGNDEFDLAVTIHEVAHVVLGHAESPAGLPHELEANAYVATAFRKHSLPLWIANEALRSGFSTYIDCDSIERQHYRDLFKGLFTEA